MKVAIIFLCLCCAGCQFLIVEQGQPWRQDLAMKRLWLAHHACRTAQHRDVLYHLSDELHRAALQEKTARASVPDLLRSLVTAPPVRTAIDPNAVAAACLARAGSLAQAAGDEDQVQRVRHLIAEHYGDPEYSFYINMVQADVSHLDSGPKQAVMGLASVGRDAVPIAHRVQERSGLYERSD